MWPEEGASHFRNVNLCPPPPCDGGLRANKRMQDGVKLGTKKGSQQQGCGMSGVGGAKQGVEPLVSQVCLAAW